MDIKPYDVVITDEPTQVQKLYRFPNGAGASVVRGEFTYGGDEGLWELAVIRFEGEGDNYKLIYPQGICSEGDVIGWLTDAEVEKWLLEVANLTADQIAVGDTETDTTTFKETHGEL